MRGSMPSLRVAAVLSAFTIASVCGDSHNAGRHQAVNLLQGRPLHGHVQQKYLNTFEPPREEGVGVVTPSDPARNTQSEEHNGNVHYIEVERRYFTPQETPKVSETRQLEREVVDKKRAPAPSRDIRDTIKTLRPLMSAIINHPLRYSWLGTKMGFWLVWRTGVFLLSFVWSLLRPFTVPFYIAIVLPSSLAMSAFGELQPLITFLLTASLLGLAIGVFAGLSNGFVSDYIITSPVVGKAAAQGRARISEKSNYAMSYFDSPSSRRRMRVDEDLDEEDAQIDADFRASLRFPPMPPPFGRHSSRSMDSGSEEGDDEEDAGIDSGASTPKAGSPIRSKAQPERPGLRHRNLSASSAGSSSGVSKPMPPPALLSPMNERPPRPPKNVRWDE